MPIFDQGYQHWQGPLIGHAWRGLAIARHGIRVQVRKRILRFLLLIAWLPAVVLVGAVAVWGLVEQKNDTVLALVRSLIPPDVLLDPRAFRSAYWTLAYSFFFKAELFFIMLLAVVAGPGLISGDLRNNALPLYFARPLTRFDYFLGKLGVIGALVASVAVGPAVFAYFVGICFSLDLSVVRDTWQLLHGSVTYGLVVTLSVGTLMLAMSSLTRRSLYVGIAWAGMWIISTSVGTTLTGLHRQSAGMAAREARIARWLAENPPPPGVLMQGTHPVVDFVPRRGVPAGVPPAQQAVAARWYQEYTEVSQRSYEAMQNGWAEAARTDWRPLCAYTANLERLAHALLGTDAAWVKIGEAVDRQRAGFGPGMRRGGGQSASMQGGERMLADVMVPQFPWIWSASVLAGLLGLATWIMTMRVKSLDRLK